MFQGTVGMVFVVMLEHEPQVGNRRARIGFPHEGDVIALHSLDKRLRHSIAVRRAYRRGLRLQADVQSKGSRMPGDVRCSVIGPTTRWDSWAVIDRTDVPRLPALRRALCHLSAVAAQLIASRPLQSSANVAPTGSPLSHLNSKPSEHHRRLLASTATRPSWRRCGRSGTGLGARSRPCVRMIR